MLLTHEKSSVTSGIGVDRWLRTPWKDSGYLQSQMKTAARVGGGGFHIRTCRRRPGLHSLPTAQVEGSAQGRFGQGRFVGLPSPGDQ